MSHLISAGFGVLGFAVSVFVAWLTTVGPSKRLYCKKCEAMGKLVETYLAHHHLPVAAAARLLEIPEAKLLACIQGKRCASLNIIYALHSKVTDRAICGWRAPELSSLPGENLLATPDHSNPTVH
jgi:hypothetical protein